MIETIIDRGNSSWADLEIVGAVEIHGGNFQGTNFVRVDTSTLDLRGGNLRGAKFDGISPSILSEVPAWVTVGPKVHLAFGWTKPKEKISLVQADKVLEAIQSADLPKAAWFDAVEIIVNGVFDMTSFEFKTEFDTKGYIIDAAKLCTFGQTAFSLSTWETFRDKIREYDMETWKCGCTQEVE